jgi:hypothetical protein
MNWTIIELKNGEYINTPKPNVPVLAILRWSSGKEIPACIKFVKGGDHSWETIDDNSELSYSIDVVKWMYIPE